MSARYLGGLGVGEAIPALPLALAQVSSLLAPQAAKVADIDARLALPFAVPNPVALAEALAAQLSNLASILSQLPALDAQARVSLVADLGAVQALVTPAADLVARLSGVLSTGGLHVWSLDARAAQIGVDLTSVTASGLPSGGGPNARARALVIATENPAAWAALGVAVRTG